MRRLIISAVAASCLTLLSGSTLLGSTLQRLSLNDMIQKSTVIVRGTVQPGASAALRGSLIYTHYQLSITTVFKGSPGKSMDVAVPGGALNGLEQPVAGAPVLSPGQDYVFFLWTGKSGLTQVIGLSQGLFSVTTNAQGQLTLTRGAANATMLDSYGQAVADGNLQMPLAQMVSKIQAVLAGGGGQ